MFTEHLIYIRYNSLLFTSFDNSIELRAKFALYAVIHIK